MVWWVFLVGGGLGGGDCVVVVVEVDFLLGSLFGLFVVVRW